MNTKYRLYFCSISVQKFYLIFVVLLFGLNGLFAQTIDVPAGLFYDSGNSVIPVGTSYDDSTGIWDLSTETINNGASYILQLAAKITPACGELTNVAQIINSDKQDPDSITNNGN